jgi:tetratricopeptide (TPR) repeat protein
MGAMLANRAQRDSKHVFSRIMPTAIVGMAPLRRTLLTLLTAISVLSAGRFARAGGDDFDQAVRQLRDKHAAALEELARGCDQQGLREQAQKTRAILVPHDPYRLYLPILPKQVGAAVLAVDAPAPVAQWNERFWRLRREQADALLDLARRAVHNGRAALAYDLLLAALWENPDQETIRHLLGYQNVNGQWCTAYEAAKHARPHRDGRSGWKVETEHFLIDTDASMEAGVELGAKLEKLYRVWQQLFVCYYATEAQVRALFEGHGSTSPWPTRRHQVVYYRDQDDYNRALHKLEPNIGITIGIYLQRMHRAYFFAGKTPDDRTLFHEATHQLFHESRAVAADVGRRGNFWIVEGIAMYMESLREENGYYVLGGFDDQRMHDAAFRLLESKFYVPLAEFTGYGMEQLQHDPRIATLYSQAAGLTHFLIHYDRGRYREALVAYLNLIYSGRDEPNSLAGLCGASYTALDGQYRQFVEEGVKAELSSAVQNAR